MIAFAHRFDSSAFRHAFAPRKPRRPWARLLLGLVGVAVLIGLVFVSVFVGIAMLAVGLVLRLIKQRGAPVARDHRVVEGEYEVVPKQALPSA